MTDSSGTVTLTTVSWRRTRRATARMMPSWRAWVSAILDRYVRRATRAGGADRVLAQPLSFVRERWLFASRTLLPQIHLAIQPVLRPRLWQARPVLASSASSDILAKRANAGSALDGGPHTRAQRTLATLREPVSAATASRVLRPPLELVFQRLRDPGRAIGATSGAPREEGLAARTSIARRFSAKSRRVEQAPADAPARVIARAPADGPAGSNPRRETPPSIVSAEPTAAWATRTPDGRWHGSRAGIPAAPQPNVNIAAIADRVMQQIDDRLHAWQERTGF